ncbi:aminopeptidase [Nesidiocoris tenuis]|uniref:Aminopeptidase n=1 Tax=Nesidiocoris tenuis TaxID=355587 RepID=A0ABN7AMV6_9HEMI|nr:aminopeptidase [Nesidiocoris tenuis]
MAQLIGSQMFPSWYSDWMTIYYDIQPAMDAEPWFLSDLNRIIDQPTPLNFNSLAAQAIYSGKGAAVMRMIAVLDPATYRFQMSQYFNHKTELGKKLLLYDYPDSVLGTKRIERILESWRVLDSYPLVTVETSSTGRVTLHQSRFVRKTKTDERVSVTDDWKALLPIMYFELDAAKKIKITSLEENGLPVLLQSVMKPFKLNWHQSGYYRVNYSKEMWTNFASVMKEQKILDPEDKANLLDDAFTLAEYGYLHHGVPLSLVVYLRDGKEHHPLPWLTAAKHLERLYRRTLGSQMTYLLEFLVKLLVQSYLEDETAYTVVKQPILDVIRKVAILDLAGEFAEQEAVGRLKYILTVFLEEGTIPLELKRVAFAHAFKGETIDDELYFRVLDSFRDETDIFKKIMIWTALVGVQNKDYVERLWELANEPDDSDVDDRFNMIARFKILSSNPLSHDYFWPGIKERWPDYHLLPPERRNNVRAILLNLIEYSNDPDVLSDISDFGKANEDLDVTYYALKIKADCARLATPNYLLFVEEWLHLYIMNST